MTALKQPVTGENRFLNRVLLDESDVRSGNYWAELRVFLAVAKAKSFNKAGEMLGISSATASRRVHRLQDLLKTDLFASTPSGVQLTPEGVDLAVMLAKLDFMLEDIAKTLGEVDEEASGEVRITMTEGLAVCYLGGMLARLSNDHPNISVVIQNPRNVNDLRQNSTDMMISFAEDTGPDVVCRKLGSVHFVPVASVGYLEKYGAPTADNLHEHVFLQSPLYSDKNAFWRPWNNVVRNGKVSHSCENSVTYHMMTKSGLGISLLANVVTLDPVIAPVDIGVHIEMPIYGVAFADTLNEAPNKIVFRYLCDIYDTSNPWLGSPLSFGHPPSIYDESFRLAFNLGAVSLSRD